MLTKHFWKTYAKDYSHHISMAIAGVIVMLILWWLTKLSPVMFMLGFTLCDPFSYRFYTYEKPTVLDTNPMPLPYNIKRAKCNHPPKHDIDGKPIICANCGE